MPNISQTRRKRWTQALRDTSGATAVEFALLAVPFFALIGAIMQTSVVFIASQVLDSALMDTARLIRIGKAQQFSSATFKQEMCGRLYGLYGDCSAMHLRVHPITDFASATATVPLDLACTENCKWTEPEQWSPGAKSSKMMVQAYFKYALPLPLGPFGMANMADGSRVIGATHVFMNEPF